VLGPENWDFRVVREDYDAGADWLWCLGHLEASINGKRCVREQYGGAQVARTPPLCGFVYEDGRRAGEVCDDKRWDHEKRHNDHSYVPQARGAPVNLGFNKMASATNAFKKCAQGLGIGLYLAARVPTADGKGQSAAVGRGNQRRPAPAQSRGSGPQPQRNGSSTSLPPSAQPNGQRPPASAATAESVCQSPNCGRPLEPVNDGSVHWTVPQLAAYGKALTKELGQEKVVCWAHYRAASEVKARRQQEQGAG
jgi:hypothetical protein